MMRITDIVLGEDYAVKFRGTAYRARACAVRNGLVCVKYASANFAPDEVRPQFVIATWTEWSRTRAATWAAKRAATAAQFNEEDRLFDRIFVVRKALAAMGIEVGHERGRLTMSVDVSEALVERLTQQK